ncbi:flagellar protein FliO/FliZ [Xanthomonas sp. 60]
MTMGLLIAAGQATARVAAPAAQHAPSAPGVFGAIIALLAVLALVLGLGWLLKRMPGTGFRPADGLKVVASVAVGAKERVVVLDVNGTQLLLGVTAGGITALHSLEQPLPAPAPVKLPDLKNLPNFAQLLQQRLRKDS